MASRDFYWLHFRFGVGVTTKGVATFGVGFRVMSSRCSSTLIMVSFAVSRRLASRQHRAISLPETFLGLVWCSETASRRKASRRSTSAFQRRILWLSWVHFRKNGILSRRRDDRRRFVSIVSYGVSMLLLV
jgi:hypothetical protein